MHGRAGRWRWTRPRNGRRWRNLRRFDGHRCGSGGRGCNGSRRRRWRRLGFGQHHALWRSFAYRCAALLAKVARYVQWPFAEAADDHTRLGDVTLEGFFQSLFVDVHFLIAKAGPGIRAPRSRARRHHGSRSDFQRHRGCLPMWLRLSWVSHDRRACRRSRRGRKGVTALKAEAHALGNTCMAFGTSHHTFAVNPIRVSSTRLTASYYTLRYFSSLALVANQSHARTRLRDYRDRQERLCRGCQGREGCRRGHRGGR